MVRPARAALAAGCGVLVAACISTQPQAPESPARAARAGTAAGPAGAAHPQLQERVLPSGLRVLWDEAPPGSLAGIVSVIRGGASLDPPEEGGLAHLVEHLTYRAVDALAPGEVATTRWNRLIHAAVAQMNGYTAPDFLVFFELAAPVQLPALIALETARLADPLAAVDEHAVALEREIIDGEHLLRSDPRAGEWPLAHMYPTLFPAGHPYARPTSGTEQSRARLTLTAARAFARNAFRPENMTILVTGPPGALSFDAFIRGLPATLRDSAARASLASPTAPVAAAPADRSDGRGPAVTHVPSPMPTRELWLAWTLPGSYGEQGPAEHLLASWLQQDLQSDQLAQEEPGIQHISVNLMPGSTAGALFVRILVAPDADAERVARVASSWVTSLWSREPAERGIFTELRNALAAQRVLDEPGQVERVLSEATDAALGGHARTLAEMLGAFEGVTSGAVAKLAYQSLTAARAHATLFTPETPAHGASAHARAATRAADNHDDPARELVPGAAGWDPRSLSAVIPEPPAITTAKAASGLTVITARQPGTAAVAWLAFRGGYADATPPLLVELALRARPDARQAPAVRMLPGRGATRDLSFDTITFRPDRINEALALLFAKATAMVNTWPTRERLTRMLAPVKAAEAARGKKAEAAFWRALFGDHRDARLVSTDDLDRVTRADVDAWLGRVHSLRSAALVVVGDVDPAAVLRAAEILSKESTRPAWVADVETPRAPAIRKPGAERVTAVVTDRPGTLVDLRLGCLLPSSNGADRAHETLLAAAMESRLNDAIRIEQGDGYGVTVNVQRLRDGATYLTAWTFIPQASLPRTLSVLRSHWHRWGERGFDTSELNVGRWRAAGTLAAAFASPNALAVGLLDAWSADPGAVGPAALRRDVASVSAARVGELFATCRANAVLGLTGDEDDIHRALDQAWPGLR